MEIEYPNGGVSMVVEREPDYPINPHICTLDVELIQNKLVLAQDVIDRTCSADNYFVGITDWIEVTDTGSKYHKLYFGDIGSFAIETTDGFVYQEWQKEKSVFFSDKKCQYFDSYPFHIAHAYKQKLIYPLFKYGKNCFSPEIKCEVCVPVKGIEIIDINRNEYRIVDLYLRRRNLADTDKYMVMEVTIFDRTYKDVIDVNADIWLKNN